MEKSIYWKIVEVSCWSASEIWKEGGDLNNY